MKAFEELKETTKKDIIIDGIMRSKGVYLLVSKPKVGKSLFALQLANSIANNKELESIEIEDGEYVYYDESRNTGVCYNVKNVEISSIF